MNLQRLAHLSHHLRSVPLSDWDFGSWRTCALGHACAIHEFRHAGLHFDGSGYPSFESDRAVQAGMRFFGLTYDEASYLFCAPPYRYGPDGVADKIDQLIRVETNRLARADVTKLTAMPAPLVDPGFLAYRAEIEAVAIYGRQARQAAVTV